MSFIKNFVFTTVLLLLTALCSSVSAGTLESFLTNKGYWQNFDWSKVYSSDYFNKLPWKKYTNNEVADYNEKYGKNKEGHVLRISTIEGNVNGVTVRASIQDKSLYGKVNTSISVDTDNELFDKQINLKILEYLKNTFGDKYVKSTTKIKENALIVTFELYEWPLKNTLISFTLISIMDTSNTKTDRYIPVIMFNNRKNTKILKPDIMLSCEQTITIGKASKSDTFDVIVSDTDESQSMRNADYFQTLVKAKVTDTAIYLNCDAFKATISRLTGNINGEIYDTSSEDKNLSKAMPKSIGNLSGKCVSVSVADRKF